MEVINCAHMTNARVMKPSRNYSGGQDKVTKAKDMLYGFVMRSEHLITIYRVAVQCSARQRLCLDHLISSAPVGLLQIAWNLQQHLFHKNITT